MNPSDNTSDEVPWGRAVGAIRHVVQDHGDEHTILGRPASLEGIRWLGSLLGWEWPPSYLEVLGKHDGVQVQDAIVFRFIESIEAFLRLHEPWHRLGYWPVATDGCGNHWALGLHERRTDGECPVVFFEMTMSHESPDHETAPTYAEFVYRLMVEQCACPDNSL